MRFRHPVEVDEALLAALEDGLAVGVAVRIGRRVDDVAGLRLDLHDLGVALLGDFPDTILVLPGQVLAQEEVELGVVALRCQSLLSLNDVTN